jgi:hypothetical protein
MIIALRCADIAALLTMHATWGARETPILHFGTITDTDGNQYRCLTPEQVGILERNLPRDATLCILKMWAFCSGRRRSSQRRQDSAAAAATADEPSSSETAASAATSETAYSVWDFMDFVFAKVVLTLGVSAKSSSLMRADKKNEKAVSSSLRQKMEARLQSAIDSPEAVIDIGTMSAAASLCLYVASSQFRLTTLDGLPVNGSIIIELPRSVDVLNIILTRIRSHCANSSPSFYVILDASLRAIAMLRGSGALDIGYSDALHEEIRIVYKQLLTSAS